MRSDDHTDDHMYFTSKVENGVLCITFSDRDLALDDVPGLHAELEKSVESIDRPRVILNLEHVHYLPTTALGAIVSTLTKVRRKHGEMRLACLNDNIDELMHIGRLDRIFEIHATVEEALASFQS